MANMKKARDILIRAAYANWYARVAARAEKNGVDIKDYEAHLETYYSEGHTPDEVVRDMCEQEPSRITSLHNLEPIVAKLRLAERKIAAAQERVECVPRGKMWHLLEDADDALNELDELLGDHPW